jgi:hypothetical protein
LQAAEFFAINRRYKKRKIIIVFLMTWKPYFIFVENTPQIPFPFSFHVLVVKTVGGGAENQAPMVRIARRPDAQRHNP